MTGREGDEAAALDAITGEEAEAAARRDPDNPPVADEEWEAGLRREAERDRYGVARLRRRLRISQVAFAERYRIPLSTLRQWEQGVREPDGAARLLLRVIEAHPDLVAAVAAREVA
jgi:putative transcriptional regulator